MLHNLIAVYLKVYALQLKQNSTYVSSTEFWEILEQLLSRIILVGCFWKKDRGEQGRAVTLAVSGLHFCQEIFININTQIYVYI